MDKNSLILEIKNDLNSIKKQVEVTLAKLAVLESMIELDKKLGVKEPAPVAAPVAEPVEAPVEELGVEEPAPVAVPIEESRDNACIVRDAEPEPIAEPVETPIAEPEPVAEPVEAPLEEPVEKSRDNACIVREPDPEEELVLRNLMSVIGLNDRFRFRHDLFSNSDELFKETIDILNKIEDFDKAVDYLVQKFAWDEEDATVVYFYDIIKPKF